jgi:hypothetical protein
MLYAASIAVHVLVAVPAIGLVEANSTHGALRVTVRGAARRDREDPGCALACDADWPVGYASHGSAPRRVGRVRFTARVGSRRRSRCSP